MKFLIEKSIVYTCDFFLTIKAYVSVIFLLQLLMWKTYSISLGTKLPSWVQNDSTDWMQNDLALYQTTVGMK